MYTSRTISAPFSFFFDSISPLAWFFFRRASFWPMILLTWWGRLAFGGENRAMNSYGAELAGFLCDSHVELLPPSIRLALWSCADGVVAVVVVVLCGSTFLSIKIFKFWNKVRPPRVAKAILIVAPLSTKLHRATVAGECRNLCRNTSNKIAKPRQDKLRQSKQELLIPLRAHAIQAGFSSVLPTLVTPLFASIRAFHIHDLSRFSVFQFQSWRGN